MSTEAVPMVLLLGVPLVSAICLGLTLQAGQEGGRWQLWLFLLVAFGGLWVYAFTGMP